MSGSPRLRDEPWYDDELEDYRHAKNDDERRQMLLILGVDDARQREADRLFNSPGQAAADPNGATENKPAQNADPETDRGKVSINRKQNRIDGIIAGIVSGLVAGLILFYWPSIYELISELLRRLFQ